MPDYPIDIVIPWVDGADSAWRQQRAQYTSDSRSDNDEARYREWDLFRYWFRGVEQYMPWVRTVHLVTWGHLPTWLNGKHPKVHVVRHEEFIPKEYLPTFSSHVIELNMHRIPGLADHFIYFNDDVYVTGAVKPEDFFRQGKPVDTAVLGVVKNSGTANYMPYIMLNMLGVLNENFSKRAVLKQNRKKWFSPQNGLGVLHNLYLMPESSFTGFRNYHTCIAYTKDTFHQVWERFSPILEQTCAHRFRSRDDVNQYLFRYWQLVTGNFEPHKPNSAYLTIGEDTADKIGATIDSPHYKIVCVNDDPMGFDFEKEQPVIHALFEKRFPIRSAYECEE
jgi:hypothetical protein